MSEYFRNIQEEEWKLNQMYLIMEQNQILKNATRIFDTSKIAKKTDLANLKHNVDKSNIDKLKNVPSNLSNLNIKVDILNVDKL